MGQEIADTESTNAVAPNKKGGGCRLFLIVFSAVLLATLLSAFLIKLYLFPGAFKPVELKNKEKLELNQKLRRLGYQDQAFVTRAGSTGTLEPQAYSEEGASREIRFSERELNGLLAKNTDLASKLAIDLADDLASARLVLPLDPDFPFFGGQTLRMSAGVQAQYRNGKPVIRLRGISVWGVPLPNAWLANTKNVDLIAEYGDQDGFWRAFADGVDEISIQDGNLFVRLKE
ncbi:MAG: hypothetical protein ACSHXK_09680 [Oceanococcus sp.]